MKPRLTEYEQQVAEQLKQLKLNQDPTESAARSIIAGQDRWAQWERLAEISAATILQTSIEAGGTMLQMALWADNNGYNGIISEISAVLICDIPKIVAPKVAEITEMIAEPQLVVHPKDVPPKFRINQEYLGQSDTLALKARTAAERGHVYESLVHFRASFIYLFLVKEPTDIETRKKWVAETVHDAEMILAGLIAPCFQQARTAGKRVIVVVAN